MILLLDESLYKRNFINSLRNSNNTDIAAFIDCTKKKKKNFEHQWLVYNTQNSMELFQLVQEQDRTRIETQTPSDQRSIGFDGVAWRGMKSFGFVRKRERERESTRSQTRAPIIQRQILWWFHGTVAGQRGHQDRPWRNVSCLFPVHLRSPPLLCNCIPCPLAGDDWMRAAAVELKSERWPRGGCKGWKRRRVLENGGVGCFFIPSARRWFSL